MALRGAGPFSARSITQWIETYHREHPAVSITYDAVGSGEGCVASSPGRSILGPAMVLS
jgi:ABC-type phosphate transport system substrate-binding protein